MSVEQPIESLTTSIMEEHSFTFVNNTLVDTFYTFMADVYIEYQHLKIKHNEDTLLEKEVKPLQSFPEFFLYKLYYNYGVKRRMSNEYIALLYYSKTAKGYKNTNPITMLCRHMMIDLRYMRIISLGIPKSVKLDEFCTTYEIDKTNPETNFNIVNDLKNEKYRLYYFSEGTMMTYNPSLKKYNITIVNTDSDDEDDDLNDSEVVNLNSTNSSNPSNPSNPSTSMDLDLEKSVEIQFNNQFMYSTRKVLGTGSFGSNKSFLDMFEENNKMYKTNLENIPSELIKDTVLVFNIEHPENNIISTIKRNTNTLCAVFRFKSENESQKEFNDIISINNSTENCNEEIYRTFKVLGKNMVIQIQVSNYQKYLTDNNVKVHFYLPKIVKSFEKLNTNTNTDTHMESKETINVNTISIAELETIVNKKSKYFHGYILYGVNGERTKITNNKYKELCELKGSKPIVINQENTKNLFYLYLRLLKQKNINKFMKEFDVENVGPITYKQIFMWFYSLIHNYSLNLFKVYHYAFVKKTFNKPDIPYSLKPLCGDLHKMYKSNNTPITNTIVEQYLFELPASKLFWRLFKNLETGLSIEQLTSTISTLSVSTNSEITTHSISSPMELN